MILRMSKVSVIVFPSLSLIAQNQLFDSLILCIILGVSVVYFLPCFVCFFFPANLRITLVILFLAPSTVRLVHLICAFLVT